MAHSSASNQFGDTTYTKVFVGGLAWETQRDAMRKYFEQFGEILEAVIITDRVTGRSKGYGFVTFKDAESARQACLDSSPIIDGRRANCNLASLGQKHRQRPQSHAGPPYVPYSPQAYGYGPYGFHPQYPPEGYTFPQGVYPPYGNQQFPMYGSPQGVYGGYLGFNQGVPALQQGFPPSSQDAQVGVPQAYAQQQRRGQSEGQYASDLQQGGSGSRTLAQHDQTRPFNSSVSSTSQRFPPDESPQ